MKVWECLKEVRKKFESRMTKKKCFESFKIDQEFSKLDQECSRMFKTYQECLKSWSTMFKNWKKVEKFIKTDQN